MYLCMYTYIYIYTHIYIQASVETMLLAAQSVKEAAASHGHDASKSYLCRFVDRSIDRWLHWHLHAHNHTYTPVWLGVGERIHGPSMMRCREQFRIKIHNRNGHDANSRWEDGMGVWRSGCKNERVTASVRMRYTVHCQKVHKGTYVLIYMHVQVHVHLFGKILICFNTMPCCPMPLLVHFWPPRPLTRYIYIYIYIYTYIYIYI